MAKSIDDLIGEFSRKLEGIYENRTAGDFTFVGVLAEFSWESNYILNGCNHNCMVNETTRAPEARHYLDCPVWKRALDRN